MHFTVTSLAEVWIETVIISEKWNAGEVTSLAEVWIETRILKKGEPMPSSLPLRKCGLKQTVVADLEVEAGHFPCGSVDWNSLYDRIIDIRIQSLPLRKCGLKHL